jgi:hypothetical protein
MEQGAGFGLPSLAPPETQPSGVIAMIPRLSAALLMLALIAPATPALAQNATVYCVNNRIMVERASLQQMRSGRGHSEICIIGPSFDFQPDGVRWVQQNLRSNVGGSCSCR